MYEVIFEQDNPHKIALSFSIGLFFGFIPLLGIQLFPMLLLILVAKLNKAATITGHILLNTFTFPFVYAFSFLVGTRVIGEDAGIIFNAKGITWAYIVSIYKPLFIGCMIVGVITSVIAYFIVKHAIYSYRVKYKDRFRKRHSDYHKSLKRIKAIKVIKANKGKDFKEKQKAN